MEYKIRKNISSFQFYNMLGDIQRLLKWNGTEEILLDFTEVEMVDALAIPNLIFLGKYIRDKTGYIPYIRLGEDVQAGRLKKYLNDINFYNVSTPFFLYENGENGKYGGMSGIDMDPRNTTQYFSLRGKKEKVEEEMIRRIYFELLPFMKRYLKQYDIENMKNVDVLSEEVFKNNVVTNLIKQMMSNCIEHAESDAVITMQANHKKKKVYVAVSDQGKGFMKAILEKPIALSDGYDVLKRPPRNELEGIYAGIYKRKNVKEYGLYNMIETTLTYDGTVRIHSNNIRLVLTPKWLKEFSTEGIINSYSLEKYNIMKTREWQGAHLEIELPL